MADRQSFDTFDKLSRQAWLDLVKKDLKGRPLSDLDWQVAEGISLPPFYTPEDGTDFPALPLPPGNPNWQVAQDFEVSKAPSQAENQRLLQALLGGVDAPCVHFAHTPGVEELARLFKGVGFEHIHTHIRLSEGVDAAAFWTNFQKYLSSRDYDYNHLKGSLMGAGYHPEGQMKTLGVDATAFHSGAEGLVEELAKTLRLGVDTLSREVPEGEAPETAFRQLFFVLHIGKSFFPAVAKLRALRLLWERVGQGYGLQGATTQLEVRFAAEAYGADPHTNMIRATTLAFSAVVGTADRIIVRPAGTPATDFQNRIARNVQHLLKMEAFLDRVQDPAAGSYYLEQLCQQLTDKAWKRFLEWETA